MSPTKYGIALRRLPSGDEIFCMDEQESGQLTSSKETLEVASAPKFYMETYVCSPIRVQNDRGRQSQKYVNK